MVRRGLLAVEIEELPYPLEIDWAHCLKDLREFGWTPYAVAKHFAIDPPTVYSWEAGSEPRHSFGAALLQLHLQICGKAYSEKLYMAARPRA